MSIELHCPHCNNLVRASEDAGGRKGKCPYCKQEVYIPTPSEKLEPLDLAPVDDEWETQKRRLGAEAGQVGNELLHERAVSENGVPEPERDSVQAEGGAAAVLPDTGAASSRRGVEALVIAYLAAMNASQLDQAESLATRIAADADRAREFAQRLSMDPVPPPELANVPPAVLRGFLRVLLGKL